MHQKKLKIYFYSPCRTLSRPVDKFYEKDQSLFINPTPLYLDSYIKANYPELTERIEWTKLQYLPLSQQDLVNEIDLFDIDVVAFSVYTWNEIELYKNIKGIDKLTKKPVKFIIGGPSVNIVRDPEYLLNLPEIEFAIYAQGEVPFVSIVKHYLDIEKISLLKTKNVAWIKDGVVKKADYEFTRITRGSPIIESRYLLEQIKNDPSLKNRTLNFPYETSRGCPYACTFCDWSSGLSHKVSKRKYVYEDELDTLGQLGFTDLYMADANFGLFPEDLGIAETMARLKKEKGYQFLIYGSNFSKTKKDIVFKIADIFVGAGITPYLKLSIQDINEEVLKNINRPDIAWDKHTEYIAALRKKYPGTIIALDIIKGLPGQTRQTWEKMFEEICIHDILIDTNDWEMIANSPAGYDKEYAERMQLKTMYRYSVSGEFGRYKEEIVGTFSYDQRDYAYFTLIDMVYNKFFRNYSRAFPEFIKLIKTSSYMESALDEILLTFTDTTTFAKIIDKFMVNLLKENIHILNPSFVKIAVKKIHLGTRADGGHIVKITHNSTEEALAAAFQNPVKFMVP